MGHRVGQTGEIIPTSSEVRAITRNNINKFPAIKPAKAPMLTTWRCSRGLLGIILDTGAPEAYLLYRGAQEAVCKVERP